MTHDPTGERPTPAQRTTRSYRKGKKRGRTMAGFLMAFGGGVVGTVWGIGSGMKDVITELLPAEDEDEEEQTGPAPAAPPPFPPFLQPPSP